MWVTDHAENMVSGRLRITPTVSGVTKGDGEAGRGTPDYLMKRHLQEGLFKEKGKRKRGKKCPQKIDLKRKKK